MATEISQRAASDSDTVAPLVEARDVSVVYGSEGNAVRALSGFTGELRAGEIVGLVGPNGSGKTTLVRAITGGVPLVSGQLRVAGDDVSALSARELALRVAVVPQTPMLPEAFRALDCVLMGRTPHLSLLQSEGETDVEIARQAMIATDVWSFADRMIGELSGGERQRVVIARALAQQSPILLLDEPTAHLDIGHQSDVLEMARTLREREGKAVLAIVHDLTIAAQYCDRLIMLDRGEIVREGHPSHVIQEDVLARVYGTQVTVFAHPKTGLPVVAPSLEDR